MNLRSWICSHRELTASDEHGFAICLECGSAVVVKLTPYILDKTADEILKMRWR